MIKQAYSFFNGFKKEDITLLMNHLLVVYSFLLPISERGKSSIFFTLLILFILRGNFKYYLQISLQNKVVQAMALYFFVHIVWLFGTENFDYATTIMKDMKYLLFPILFLSFLDKRFFVRILTAFILGMLYSEMLSYLIHFNIIPNQLTIYQYEIYEAFAVGNPSPFLNHARYTVLLSLSIAIILYNILNNPNSWFVHFTSILFLITASINLSLIGGRIGYISFLFIIMYVVILRYKKHFLKSFIVLLSILVLVSNIAYNYSDMLKYRIDTSLNSFKYLLLDKPNLNTSIGQRLGIWMYSAEVIQDNILFGVGTGDQLDEVKKLIPEQHFFLKKLSHVHNEYVKSFSQFGLIGFLLFLNIFYQIFRHDSLDTYRNDIKKIVTIVVMIAILTSIFGSKIYLPLFVVLISATTATKSFAFINFQKVTINTLLRYIFLVLLALLISVLQ